ncbi:hypothetical protein EYZ11_011267 [Aspergillus tanneri]|uniref:Uncharacterized protein n=1 Tax=Aspergillus tanneri TaxID=1220188 RepID=A0A4S3J3W3_9EURO|nr:hypothetical protein EYZ11_011267 [Aspergillus tanneri]
MVSDLNLRLKWKILSWLGST